MERHIQLGEKEYWLEKSNNTKIPFEYDFYYGYSNLYSTYEMLIIGVIAICICLASVFAGEYQNGTDKILLTTKYGKSKGVTAKILASYIFASIVFTIYLIFANRKCILNVWYRWRKFTNTAYLNVKPIRINFLPITFIQYSDFIYSIIWYGSD